MAMCYMDPKAYCYYLPAYLVWQLKYAPMSTSFTGEATLYHLDPDLHGEQMKDLSAAQRRDICRFLHVLVRFSDFDRSESLEAKKPLRKYWGRFCDEPEKS